MRIISGELKGRRLASWPAAKNPQLRPMTDQARERLFNVLFTRLSRPLSGGSSRGSSGGFLFLDLFSGTGSLAIEALSRGAMAAHAVESHPGSLKILEKNRQILSQPEKLIIHKKDVFLFLRSAAPRRFPLPPPFLIVAADPPFSLKAGDRLMALLAASALCRGGSLAALETGQEENLKEVYQPFRLFSKKSFNDKKLWFYEAKTFSPGRLSGQL